MNETYPSIFAGEDEPQSEKAMHQARIDSTRLFVATIERERDACVDAKAPIEQRWVDDCKRHDGELDYEPTKSHHGNDSTNNVRREPHIGFVRSRCNMVASRLANMVFPSHEASWEIKPTPKSDIGAERMQGLAAEQQQAIQQAMPPMGDPGMGMPPEGMGGMMAPMDPGMAPMGPTPEQMEPGAAPDQEDADKLARDAAERMATTVADQLAECRFNAAGRRMIEDCVIIGTGVMKGPVMSLQTRRRVKGGRVTLRREESHQPSAEYVDPWYFFPELTETMEECTQTHELHPYTKRMMTDLIGDEFFDPGSVEAVLETAPELGAGALRTMANRCRALSQTNQRSAAYAVWETHKFLDEDDLRALGIEEEEPEAMPLYEIWHCNGILLMARPAIITGDNRVPYFTVPYAKADDTMFGFGVSYLLRSGDQDIHSAWKMTLHNAAISSGPLVITEEGRWEPADKDFQIRGPKTILARAKDDEVVDLTKLFHVVTFGNNTQQHLTVLQKAIELADEEIGMPAIMSGNPSENVQTSSGLALLMNASNIVQQRFAMQFDDYLIVPLIERMCWWNMIYSNDQSIMGDFDVQPLGTSHLLVKDIQAQHVQVFSQMAQNPDWKPYIDQYELIVMNTKLLDLPSNDALLDRDVAEKKMAEAGKDPMQAMQELEMQLKQAELELKAKRAQDEADDKARDDDFRSQDRLMKHDEFMVEQETRRLADQTRVQLAAEQRELQLMQMAGSQDIEMAKINSMANIAQLREHSAKLIAGFKVRAEAEKSAVARQEMALKLDPRNQSNLGI